MRRGGRETCVEIPHVFQLFFLGYHLGRHVDIGLLWLKDDRNVHLASVCFSGCCGYPDEIHDHLRYNECDRNRGHENKAFRPTALKQILV